MNLWPITLVKTILRRIRSATIFIRGARCTTLPVMIAMCGIASSVCSVDARCQQAPAESRMNVGVFVGAQSVIHDAVFTNLAGFPSCCPQYSSGSGSATVAGLGFEFASIKNIRHSVRASVSAYDGTLSAAESIPVVVDGTLQTARIQHTLRASIKALDIEPLIHAELTPRLGVFAGFRCSFLYGGTAEQFEELLAPATGTFENNARIRNRKSGNIFALQPLMASVVAGIRTTLPLSASGGYVLVPEISASAGVSSITGNETWRANTIRAGVSIMHRIAADAPPVQDSATLDVHCDISPGDEQRDFNQLYVGLRLRERNDIIYPLPVVFFDSQDGAETHSETHSESTTLPPRFLLDTASSAMRVDNISEPSLAALRACHNVLSVYGRRVAANRSDTLSIIAIVDDTSAASPAAERALRRGQAIAFALRTTFGIERGRLRVLRASSAECGLAGNGTDTLLRNAVMVRVSSGVPEPLRGQTIERVWVPPVVRLRPQLRGTDVLRDWEIRVTLKGETLRVWRGTSSLPSVLTMNMKDYTIAPFTPAQFNNEHSSASDSIIVQLTVSGRANTLATTRVGIPVRVLRDTPDSVRTIVQAFPTIMSNEADRTALAKQLQSVKQPGSQQPCEWRLVPAAPEWQLTTPLPEAALINSAFRAIYQSVNQSVNQQVR